ncbi:MAG: VWA domain-containing protein, partial [Candidatus Delongbacteria bacterium]
MEKIIFFKPEYLRFLWILIPLVILVITAFKSRIFYIHKIVSKRTAPAIIPNFSRKKILIKKIFQISAAALIIFALAGPKIGTKMVKMKRQGIDIVVAVDLSRSMYAEDVFPNRLKKTKHEVKNFINKLEGDRIALVGFTSKAYVQCPLTFDYDAALMFLDIMDVSMIPQNGTSLSEAVRVSNSVFSDEESKHKLLIIISDGEDHEEG